MNTQVTTPLSFEQKLKEKIKDSIGDLMSDEDLSKLVSRGIEESFFTKRPNPRKGYYNNGEPEFLPPLIHELLADQIKPIVNEQIKNYIKEHNEEILAVVQNVVTAGVGNAVVQAMNMQFSSQLLAFQSNIQNQLSTR